MRSKRLAKTVISVLKKHVRLTTMQVIAEVMSYGFTEEEVEDAIYRMDNNVLFGTRIVEWEDYWYAEY